MDQDAGVAGAPAGEQSDVFRLYDLRIAVDRIEGRSVCGMKVGDYVEITDSCALRLPAGQHFCLYALQSVLPMVPAKQRQGDAADWMEHDTEVCCPDPEERLVMRIERTGTAAHRRGDLT